jgi:hypothetical protein
VILTRTLLLTLLASVSVPALAQTVTPTLDQLSSSAPKLKADSSGYEDLDIRQAVPSGGKGGIRVQYIPDDALALPLDSTGAVVKLRPRGLPAADITCTYSPVAQILSPATSGKCFFRTFGGAGDMVQIHHFGLLQRSDEIHYSITGVQGAVPGFTVLPFDSDTAFAGAKPIPNVGRNPARLALVFDKSGSMDWSAKPAGDPGCGAFFSPVPACRRWNILNDAAAQMANVAKAYATPGDELGVVFFDSTASNTGGLAGMNTITLDAALGAIGARAPGGSTSIGAGVENLKAPLLSNAAAHQNTVLLFTDGEQNTAPFLTSDGTQLLINPTQNLPFGTPWVGMAPVSLCPFRLRTDDPAGPGGTTTLQQIADNGCGGLMGSPATLKTPADLITFFLQVLDKTLVGDKLELISITHGAARTRSRIANPTVLRRLGNGVSIPFRTSAQDGAVTLLLNWSSPGGDTMPSDLKISKDGIDFDPLRDRNVVLARGKDHLVMTLRAPFCNDRRQCVKPAGDWSLGFVAGGQQGPALNHSLFVLGDNATLASDFKVDQPALGIGKPLRLTARLTDAGRPVSKLAAGSVYALIGGPTASLGTILSKSPVRPQGRKERDPVSLAGAKAAAMFAAGDKGIVAATAFNGQLKVPLKETTRGVYTAQTPAPFEGVYRVTFMVDAKTPLNGPFQRIYTTDRYVGVAIDAATTLANTTIGAGSFNACPRGRCISVQVRPVDQRGNLTGPGKGALFSVDPKRAMIAEVIDRLDGSYALTIALIDPTALPDLIIGGAAKVVLPLAPVTKRAGGKSPR